MPTEKTQTELSQESQLSRSDSPPLQEPEGVESFTEAQILAMLSERLARPVTLVAAPVMELTPRSPWSSGGSIDASNLSRWSASANEIGVLPRGAAEGTFGYIYFTPPSRGSYLVKVEFRGEGATIRVWGTNSVNQSTAAKGPDPTTVAALVTAETIATIIVCFDCVNAKGTISKVLVNEVA